jgi:hypothetical protein
MNENDLGASLIEKSKVDKYLVGLVAVLSLFLITLIVMAIQNESFYGSSFFLVILIFLWMILFPVLMGVTKDSSNRMILKKLNISGEAEGLNFDNVMMLLERTGYLVSFLVLAIFLRNEYFSKDNYVVVAFAVAFTLFLLISLAGVFATFVFRVFGSEISKFGFINATGVTFAFIFQMFLFSVGLDLAAKI